MSPRALVLPLVVLLGCDVPNAGVDGSLPPPEDAGCVACVPDSGAPDAGTVDAGEVDAGAPPNGAFGATVTQTGTTFRVWAPHATAAWVEGDFSATPLPLESEPGGVFALDVAGVAEGATYRFTFDTPSGHVTRVDPYCRQLDTGTFCRVLDPSRFAWHDQGFVAAPRRESVVYELHVGSFAVDAGASVGTFEAARAKLPELADLGVNVVELMPVHAFGGNAAGWGYNPQLFFAPKASYGTADELRAFIDDAHRLGIAVWVDFVVNHLDGWSRAPLACFDGYCPSGHWSVFTFPSGAWASTPWGPRPNYEEPRVKAYLLDATRAWLDDFHGDGFRWDSVSNVRANDGNGTAPGGRELLVEANALTHARGGLSVAEDLKGWDAITRDAASGGFGFDAQWDGFGWAVSDLLVPYSDDGRNLDVVKQQLQGGYAGDAFARLLWTENHDTVGNGGARLPSRIDPANPESVAARRRSALGAAMLLTMPGVPMLFMGQEQLALGGFTDPPKALGAPTAKGAMVRELWKDLIALRRNLAGDTKALSEAGVQVLHFNASAKVIAYRRFGPSTKDVVVVLNLRNKSYARYDIGVPAAGPWRVRVDSEWKKYGDDLGGGQVGPLSTLAAPYDAQPVTLPLQLGPYGVVVLTK